MERHIDPRLTLDHLKQFSRLAAQYTEQRVSEEHPLLSATLPTGYRLQVVFPPAVEPNTIALSIRRQSIREVALSDWVKPTSSSPRANNSAVQIGAPCVQTTCTNAPLTDSIKEALAKRRNILISGGTSTGKTTFLNTCLREVPLNERILTIEDAREINVPHANRLHLLSSRGDQGRARVSTQQLLEAALRLRPDRIILGEIRGSECVTYWSAVNSGHPGSLTSIHADTPQLAFEKLVMLGMQAGLGFSRDHIIDYLRQTVDVVVQLRRDSANRRFISDIWYVN